MPTPAVRLECGWKAANEGVETESGICAFTAVGLPGGLAERLQVPHGINAIILDSVAVTLLAEFSYGIALLHGRDAGRTSEFALLVTFLLGAEAGMGYWTASAGISTAPA